MGLTGSKSRGLGWGIAVGGQGVDYYYFFFLSFVFSKTAPRAYGGSQARGQIGPIAAGLRHSHSNAGPELRLQPTPQFKATPDPQPAEQGAHGS